MNSFKLNQNFYNQKVLFDWFFKDNKFIVVVFLSGVFGFFVGVSHSTWQAIAESSQVLSGIVQYPIPNPFYIYQIESWTILNQVGALFLHMGGAEKTLSIVVSGMMGTVYFLGFSILVFALCQNTFLAISTPFLMHFLTLDADFGVTYPFQITDSVHSYGILGQGFAFLVLALFCAKKFKIGGFLLGISLSIHPAIGGFLCLTLFLSFLWDYKKLLASFIVALKYFFCGALISGVSLIFYIKLSEHIPVISESLATNYRYIVAKYWDHHRGKITVLSIGTLIGTISFLFSFIIILFSKKDVPGHMHFPLQTLLVAGIIGGIGVMTTFFSPRNFSPLLVAAMPSRWLNINVIGFIPLFIGISAWYKKNSWLQVNLFFFISTLVLVLTFHPPTNWGRLVLGVILFPSLGFIVLWNNSFGILNLFNRIKLEAHIPRQIIVFSMCLVVFGMVGESFKAWESSHDRLLNWQNDSMFKKLHEKQGVILLDPRIAIPIQLYTRRPELLGDTISSLPYAPSMGPLVESILKEVFDEDLFNPSEEAKNVKDIPGDMVKSLWESRTTREWKKIGEKFKVVDILALSDLKLQLPISYGPEKKSLNSRDTSMHNKIREYIVYQIPL